MTKTSFSFLSVSLGDRILFVKHLAIAIKSGMTLVDGLHMIEKQTQSKSLKKIIATVIIDIDNGSFLSASLEKYRSIFGDLFINLIRVGESSGTLMENLTHLAEEMKKQDVFRKKVRGALIYPAVIVVATIGITGGMVGFIFPKILPIFRSLNIQLPFTTKLLMNMADFVSSQGVYVLGGFITLLIALVILVKVRAVKFFIHNLLLIIPFVKSIVIKINLANFARIFGLLLKSGIQITDAIHITGQAINNLVYRKELEQSKSTIQEGSYLSSYFEKRKNLFPPLVVNMMAVGERTGNLTENLFFIAQYYEDEVDDIVKNLSSVLEPALLVVMGLVVGFIAVSIVTPIYQITQNLTL